MEWSMSFMTWLKRFSCEKVKKKSMASYFNLILLQKEREQNFF